jgi:integral membrane protein (TIGR01906 family)
MPNRLPNVLSWLVTLLVPFTLIVLGVRILLSPIFPQIEYRMPNFPADTYGFTFEDRLKWSKPSIEYLINDADISFLADLKFDDGTPIYDARELSHMLDVKTIVRKLLNIWDADLLLLLALGLWAWRGGWIKEYRAGWRRGGFLTLGLLAVIGVFALTSFWDFFTAFHTLFFTGDSWLFYYSDTLIRLFPIRFWMDCFAYIAGIMIILSLALAFGLKEKPG